MPELRARSGQKTSFVSEREYTDNQTETPIYTNPTCDCETTVFTTVGCDIGGSVVDYSDLPFCSDECLKKFRALGPWVDTKIEQGGMDCRIFSAYIPTELDAN